MLGSLDATVTLGALMHGGYITTLMSLRQLPPLSFRFVDSAVPPIVHNIV